MRKILTIIASEYARQVHRRAFIGALLFPLFMIALIGVIMLIVFSSIESQVRGVIGYYDPGGALAAAVAPPDSLNAIAKLESVDAGRNALEREEIIAFFVLAPDFAGSGQAELLYWKNEPSRDVTRSFEAFARMGLLADRPAEVRARLVDGLSITLTTSDGSRSLDSENPVGFFIPLALAFFFVITVFSGAQYLLQSVVDEKQSRTIEILVTSVSPGQLMTGKIVGLALVGLTQIAAWTVAGLAVVMATKPRVPFLNTINIEPQLLIVALLMLPLQYLLLGSMMAAVGATVVDQKDGQNAAGPFSLLAMSPMFFLSAIIIDPNGLISTLLSLIPIVSPLAMVMRVGMASVPIWQIALSASLMAACVAGAFWLSGRIFRIGMLEYGKSLPLLNVVKNLRI